MPSQAEMESGHEAWGDGPSDPFIVDVVMPTHNRRDIVTAKVAWLLSLPAVNRVIVHADACTDGTESALRALAPDRVEVLSASPPRGPHGGRNRAIQKARTEWIVVVDDDDRHPADFIERLADAARESGGDIVGAPWLNVQGPALATEVARRRARPELPRLDAFGRFPPARWVETPWLPPSVLARRSLFDALSYDEGYRGNFWREETDLFVSAARAGRRVILTSLTYSAGGPRGAGGIGRQKKLRYELSAVANNRRFLAKHGRWLVREGLISSVARAESAFVIARMRYRIGGAVRARSYRYVKAIGRAVRR